MDRGACRFLTGVGLEQAKGGVAATLFATRRGCGGFPAVLCKRWRLPRRAGEHRPESAPFVAAARSPNLARRLQTVWSSWGAATPRAAAEVRRGLVSGVEATKAETLRRRAAVGRVAGAWREARREAR